MVQQGKSRPNYEDDIKSYDPARAVSAHLLELRAQLGRCDNSSDRAKMTPLPNWAASFLSISRMLTLFISAVFTPNLIHCCRKIKYLATYGRGRGVIDFAKFANYPRMNTKLKFYAMRFSWDWAVYRSTECAAGREYFPRVTPKRYRRNTLLGGACKVLKQ